MKVRKSEQGIAHLALIVVVAVAVVVAAGAFVYMKQKGPDSGKLKADASGAYSTLCGSGFNLLHTTTGSGFNMYNYSKGSQGCAIVVNSNWGTAATLYVKSYWKGSLISHDGPKTYKYYAGPIYYGQAKGVQLVGAKNGYAVQWILQTGY